MIKKVLAFDQSADFYAKKAEKYLDEENYIDALVFLRKAVKRDPENAEYLLLISDILTEVGLYDDSNYILMGLCKSQQPEVLEECFFGMGINFMALNDVENARAFFLRCMEISPQGEFSQDVYEFLKALEPEEELLNGVEEDPIVDEDEYGYRIDVSKLTQQMQLNPFDVNLKNKLVILYFLGGEIERALELTQEALKIRPKDVEANCNLAILYYHMGREQESREIAQELLSRNNLDVEEKIKLTMLMVEIKNHQAAFDMMSQVLEYRPYDIKFLFICAVAQANLGQMEQAQEYLMKIIKLEPYNLIAHSFLNLVKKEGGSKKYDYFYKISPEEYKGYLKKIDGYDKMNDTRLAEQFAADEQMRTVLAWALIMGKGDLKVLAASIFCRIPSWEADQWLRYALMRSDIPPQTKNDIAIFMYRYQLRQPYIAYVDQKLVEITVAMDKSDYAQIRELIKMLSSDAIKELCLEILDNFIMENPETKVSNPHGFAAALCYLCAAKLNEPIDRQKVIATFNVKPKAFTYYVGWIRKRSSYFHGVN